MMTTALTKTKTTELTTASLFAKMRPMLDNLRGVALQAIADGDDPSAWSYRERRGPDALAHHAIVEKVRQDVCHKPLAAVDAIANELDSIRDTPPLGRDKVAALVGKIVGAYPSANPPSMAMVVAHYSDVLGELPAPVAGWVAELAWNRDDAFAPSRGQLKAIADRAFGIVDSAATAARQHAETRREKLKRAVIIRDADDDTVRKLLLSELPPFRPRYENEISHHDISRARTEAEKEITAEEARINGK